MLYIYNRGKVQCVDPPQGLQVLPVVCRADVAPQLYSSSCWLTSQVTPNGTFRLLTHAKRDGGKEWLQASPRWEGKKRLSMRWSSSSYTKLCSSGTLFTHTVYILLHTCTEDWRCAGLFWVLWPRSICEALWSTCALAIAVVPTKKPPLKTQISLLCMCVVRSGWQWDHIVDSCCYSWIYAPSTRRFCTLIFLFEKGRRGSA